MVSGDFKRPSISTFTLVKGKFEIIRSYLPTVWGPQATFVVEALATVKTIIGILPFTRDVGHRIERYCLHTDYVGI